MHLQRVIKAIFHHNFTMIWDIDNQPIRWRVRHIKSNVVAMGSWNLHDESPTNFVGSLLGVWMMCSRSAKTGKIISKTNSLFIRIGCFPIESLDNYFFSLPMKLYNVVISQRWLACDNGFESRRCLMHYDSDVSPCKFEACVVETAMSNGLMDNLFKYYFIEYCRFIKLIYILHKRSQ